MSTITMWFKKTLLAGLIAALGLVSIPLASAYASGPSDLGTPTPSNTTTIPADRLQRAFAREQKIYNRLGKLFDNANPRLTRFENFIDKAKAEGKDVTALQSALNALEAALTQAQSTYQSAQGVIASHAGFDASGNVTDPAAALQTVKDLRSDLKDIRQTVIPPLKALRQAIRAFREANSPNLAPSATPSGG
jgi:hypothetical protein